MKNQRIPILVYHHVYPDQAPELKQAAAENPAGVVGEAEFRRQMRYVLDHNWRVVSTTQILDWLLDGAALPERALALHFDNGWLDTCTVAMPILKDLGVTGTCYPITNGIEAASGGEAPAVRTLTEGRIRKPFMTWDHVRALLDAGWEIGAHTATHPKLADKHADDGDTAVLHEAKTANARFQQRLGLVPSHFAYPSGSRNPRTDELLAPLYRSLRLWHFDFPITWTFTDGRTSPLAIDCQNIDLRVTCDDFERLFTEALAP